MKTCAILLAVPLVLFALATTSSASPLHLVIMSATDAKQEAPKYEALSAYLRAANPLLGEIKLRIAKDYTEAATLFERGDAEGMFSGSFVAAVLIAKGLARPVARPLGADGVSTYKALIVARDGTRSFSGIADFAGKRVTYSPLASAGDIFVRNLLGPERKPESVFVPVPVASHQAALAAVTSNDADYAVVKSTVFVPARFPGLVVVGADTEEHPDNTLIMSGEGFSRYGAIITRALLGLEGDTSEKAAAVKQAFGCTSFIATQVSDFVPTFKILKRAGVDAKTFRFAF